MYFVDVAGTFINLDHVAFVRKEDHAQLGRVVAVHFITEDVKPIHVSEEYYQTLRRHLLTPAAHA